MAETHRVRLLGGPAHNEIVTATEGVHDIQWLEVGGGSVLYHFHRYAFPAIKQEIWFGTRHYAVNREQLIQQHLYDLAMADVQEPVSVDG